MKNNNRTGFTFIELLVVIAIIAILSIGVIYFLNPSQLTAQGRDSNRLSDMTTLNQNIALYHELQPAGSLGSSSILYVSIPDPNATTTAGTNCAGLGLPSGNVYHCAASSTYRMTNGTGWIPINFGGVNTGNLLPTLPVDPVNTTTSKEYYVYVTNGSQYEILSNPEAQKTIASNNSSSYIQGNDLALQTSFPSGGTGGGTSSTYIYVLDELLDRVEVFNMSGTYVTQFGSFGTGNGQWSTTYGGGLGPDGSIYVAELGSERVLKFASDGTFQFNIGSSGSGNGQFDHPVDVATDNSGNVYVLDMLNDRVEKFSSGGSYLSQFGSFGTSTGEFWDPEGIAVDSSGNIYVSDSGNNRVQKFDSNGGFLLAFGSSGSGNGQFYIGSTKLAIDASGNVFVGNQGQSVEKFNSSGTYLSQFGSSGVGNGQFLNNEGIAIDSSGNIYVTDFNPTYNSQTARVEEFSSSGVYLSQFGSYGSSTGQFEEPQDIFIK